MTTKNLPAPGPTIPSNRITSLDVLRGLAVMGILVANMQSFAMPTVTTTDPAAFGGFSGFDYVVALLTIVLVRGKFLTIFSMLFGAGIVLMTQRLEKKGGKPVKRHYMRMFWLLIIGGTHASLIWGGDILAHYAISGLFVFLFRKLSARKIFIYAVVLYFIPTVQSAMFQVSLSNRDPGAMASRARFMELVQSRIPAEIKNHQKGWLEQTAERTSSFWSYLKTFGTRPLAMVGLILRFCAWMLAGMALFKWNMLNARAPAKTYRKFLFLGLGIGLILPVQRWISNSLSGWNFASPGFSGHVNWWKTVHNFLASSTGHLLLCTGYIAAVMLICRAGKLPRFTDRLAAVGRMALTNYLMHSLICTFLFNGYGFGLFGKVERSGQFLIILAILIFQLWLSPLWLKHFRFGPVEWLWRSLSYWKRQPMRITGKRQN